MIDCNLTAVTHNMPLLKLNKTTSHKEQELGLLFNEIPMVIKANYAFFITTCLPYSSFFQAGIFISINKFRLIFRATKVFQSRAVSDCMSFFCSLININDLDNSN